MTYDTSQGNVAVWLRCGGTFHYYFIRGLQIYRWVCFEIFL